LYLQERADCQNVASKETEVKEYKLGSVIYDVKRRENRQKWTNMFF